MLNLVNDAWIRVRRKDGSRAVIAPWQVADDSLAIPDWPRPDLNIACLELLIGLVFLADPPRDAEDWDDRRAPDPDRLRDRLAPFAPAFELMGDGPRFCQDVEAFEEKEKKFSPDLLFFDHADEEKQKKNSDLMVRRGRYLSLDPATAAMALFLLQSWAPAGGRGHMTSLRGGGPLVTLVDPGEGLWSLVWANVPDGTPSRIEDIRWMRPGVTKATKVHEHEAPACERFFGMPRRVRLVSKENQIVAVCRRPNGMDYGSWLHPLTPYVRKTEAEPFASVKAAAGSFSYVNWLGTVLKNPGRGDNAKRAWVVENWQERGDGRRCEVIVAGWAFKKGQNKVLDFTFSRAPLLDLPDELAERVEGLVGAAEQVALALRGALAPVLAEGEAREAAREAFFALTQGAFEARLAQLTAVNSDPDAVARGWLGDLGQAALQLFDSHSLPGLGDRDIRDQREIVQARRNLTATLAGYGKTGQGAWRALGLSPPEQKRRRA